MASSSAQSDSGATKPPTGGDGHGGIMRAGSSADFPTDAEGRVMHLQIRKGQLANRVLSVGDSGRAKRLADALLPGHAVHGSSRGFSTYTGLYKGTPISIVATGMGTPMMDFVVREGAAIVSGEMAVVRLGTCGGLAGTKPGNVIVSSRGCALVRLEPDFVLAADHRETGETDGDTDALPMRPTAALPYSISRVVPSDEALSEAYAAAMEASLASTAGDDADLSGYTVQRAASATADGFYASQGRLTAEFADRNAGLVDEIERRVPGVAGLEMETFQLLCLAAMSRGRVRASAAAIPLVSRRGGEWLEASHMRPLELAGGRAALEALAGTELEGAMAADEIETSLT